MSAIEKSMHLIQLDELDLVQLWLPFDVPFLVPGTHEFSRAIRGEGGCWFNNWGEKLYLICKKSCQRLVDSMVLKFYVILVCISFQMSHKCLPSVFSYGNEKRMSPDSWLGEFLLSRVHCQMWDELYFSYIGMCKKNISHISYEVKDVWRRDQLEHLSVETNYMY